MSNTDKEAQAAVAAQIAEGKRFLRETVRSSLVERGLTGTELLQATDLTLHAYDQSFDQIMRITKETSDIATVLITATLVFDMLYTFGKDAIHRAAFQSMEPLVASGKLSRNALDSLVAGYEEAVMLEVELTNNLRSLQKMAGTPDPSKKGMN